jgi:hypothetical protein
MLDLRLVEHAGCCYGFQFAQIAKPTFSAPYPYVQHWANGSNRKVGPPRWFIASLSNQDK